MSNEVFPEPLTWNGEDTRFAEPGMEVNPHEDEESDEREAPDLEGMAQSYEDRKREALGLAIHKMGSEDLKACIERLWEAIYKDYLEPPDAIWAALRVWDIEWSQLQKGKP